MAPSVTGRLPRVRGAALAIALLSTVACGGSPTTQPTPPPGVPGAIPVRGSEQLAWDQAGYTSDLRFRAYVDGTAAPLDRATCDAAAAGSSGAPCLSPLPPLTEGVHTIALTAYSQSTSLESARSAALTLQKLPASVAISASQIEDGVLRFGARAIDDTLTTSDGLTFDVRVMARRLVAPTQLALAPDDRLFVAEKNGRVHVLRMSGAGPPDSTVALDARALLDLPAAGPPGLALHPDFARNRLVYFAVVVLDEDDEARLRVVRLREVGDTLGEPATLFDEALKAIPAEGQWLAFGPDRLLYIALPGAIESTPGAPRARTSGGVILRLRDDGRAVEGSAMYASGVERPVGFAWHPRTYALWAVLAGADGRATLRAIGAGERFGASNTPASPSLDVGVAFAPGGLLFDQAGAAGTEPAVAWIASPDNESLWRVTFSSPARTEVLLPRALGRIGAIVQSDDGVLYLTTRNRDGRGIAADGDDLVVRLTPRRRALPWGTAFDLPISR